METDNYGKWVCEPCVFFKTDPYIFFTNLDSLQRTLIVSKSLEIIQILTYFKNFTHFTLFTHFPYHSDFAFHSAAVKTQSSAASLRANDSLSNEPVGEPHVKKYRLLEPASQDSHRVKEKVFELSTTVLKNRDSIENRLKYRGTR